MMMLNQLPHEIISDILSRLPFEYAIPCKEVCRTWRSLLRHIKRDKKTNLLIIGKHGSDGMQFYHGEYDEKSNRKLHEQLSYDAVTPLGFPCQVRYPGEFAMQMLYPNELRVSSHRGLVCFHEADYNDVNDPIYICNPFKQETVRLPELPVLPEDALVVRVISGFGYLYATNEYKIVRIYYKYGDVGGQVHVYTLSDKSGWRNKGTTSHYLRSQGILSNGALHWIDNMGLEIVAFDLTDEKFRSVPIPPCFRYHFGEVWGGRLLMLGGYLSVSLRGNSTTDIWLLKETKNESGYTVKEHWSTEFTVPSKDYRHPFALTEENKILMRLNRFTLRHYDPNTATSEEVTDERFRKYQVLPYMKSDVSLTALAPELQVDYWVC